MKTPNTDIDYPYYLPKELTQESLELIFKCPHLINRLSASLERIFENISRDDSVLEPIVIQHVGYSDEALGYADTK